MVRPLVEVPRQTVSLFWRGWKRRQRVDFLVGREAAELFLGKFKLAVDGDLEHAAAGADEFGVGAKLA